MAFGLQCWDASGKLVVDLSDYNCRYIGTYDITIPRGQNSATVGVAGISATTAFGAIVKPNFFIEAFAEASTNAITVYRLFGTSYGETYTVEVYSYA